MISAGYALTGTLVYPDNHFTGREQELTAIQKGLLERYPL